MHANQWSPGGQAHFSPNQSSQLDSNSNWSNDQASNGGEELSRSLQDLSLGDFESLVRHGFKSIELLFRELDEDRCGSVSFSQMKVFLQARGLKESAKLTELWHKNIDKDHSNRVDMGEFLVIVFFWRSRNFGSYRDLTNYDLVHASTIRMAMEELEKQYRKYDTSGDLRLSWSELSRFFAEKLPRVSIAHAAQMFSQNNQPIGFSQFMKLLFVSLGGKLESVHDEHGQVLQNSRTWRKLKEMYQIMEEDFAARGHGGSVTLLDLLRPEEHTLQPFSAKPGQLCDVCYAQAAYCCPQRNCHYFVCTACYAVGIRQHIASFPGPGRDTVRECVRQNFQLADVDHSGRLDFSEFAWFAYNCCSTINYLSFCPSSRGSAVVKAGIMFLGSKFSRFDKDGSNDLTRDELSAFCNVSFGAVPPNASSLFKQIAGQSSSIRLKDFFSFLYHLVLPDGKYAVPQQKPPAQSPQLVGILPESAPRPPLPVVTYFDQSKIRWGKQLGKGGQTTVFMVTYEGYTLAARKPQPKASENLIQSMIRGAKTQMKFQHPNIARVVAIHEGRPMCVLMELCDGGDVNSLWSSASSGVNPIMPSLQWRLAMELAEALNVLHTANPPIIHRDIKGCNVFLDKNRHLLLADFDLATSPPAQGTCGTPGYMAPEVLTGSSYDCSCDVFAYGGFLYEITHACFPFSREVAFNDFHEQVRKRILSGQMPYLTPTVPSRMRQLITQCWQFQASARPTMATIISQLHGMRSDFP